MISKSESRHSDRSPNVLSRTLEHCHAFQLVSCQPSRCFLLADKPSSGAPHSKHPPNLPFFFFFDGYFLLFEECLVIASNLTDLTRSTLLHYPTFFHHQPRRHIRNCLIRNIHRFSCTAKTAVLGWQR